MSQRTDFYKNLFATRLVPLFYEGDPATAENIAASCAAGGAACVEVTNRGPGALQVVEHLVRRLGSGLVVGVGSIYDAPTAALFIAAGARFVVGPTLAEEVAVLCNRRKVPYIPGCATVNEIARAHELGAEVVKLFPGEVGGPGFIKALRGPMPWAEVMPTGGVEISPESIGGWISAGACAVGIGSKLVSAELVKTGDFGSIQARVEVALRLIAAAGAP